VAVKLIHPRLAEDPGFAQALAREARRVAGLSERGSPACSTPASRTA